MTKNKPLLYIILALVYAMPLAIALSSLLLGSIPFWYDPARDLILALGNQQKISLIGQTSGIPGIFYGPYWIWFLSFALFISKDPRVVAFIVLTIPYFTVVPYVLYKLKKIWGSLISILLWLIFMTSFSAYSVQIWNPHLAPILCLLIIHIMTGRDYNKMKTRDYIKIFLGGILGGLLVNIHISFGLSLIVGTILFLILMNNRQKTVPIFILGVLVLFVPFFVFELRHGFNQIKVLFDTIFSTTAVVNDASNIHKKQIFIEFFKRLSLLLNIPENVTYVLSGAGLIYFFTHFKKVHFNGSKTENNMGLYISILISALFGIYLTTKNPVWDYHFIGVEIIFLMLIGLFASKQLILKYALAIWTIIICVTPLYSFSKQLNSDPYKVSSLTTKEHIVKTVYDDAKENTFSVFIYSPATYTPDFDYLLMLEGEKRNKHSSNNRNTQLAYLIIPWTTEDLKADFIDNRTPNEIFSTASTWHIADETVIIKRQVYKNN